MAFCWMPIVLLGFVVLATQFDFNLCQLNRDDDPKYWLSYAKSRIMKFKQSLDFKMTKRPNNVILFVGDGFSIHTGTAARYLKANQANQLAGQAQLVWDEWEVASLVQTFSSDRMTTDSGCAATSLFSGVKGAQETLGVTAGAKCCQCYQLSKEQQAVSAFEFAARQGLSTGFVTTTRITHATPASTFASTPNREWESETQTVEEGGKQITCPDIASQMIDRAIDFNVIMGGGWKHFYKTPSNHTPPSEGTRPDSKNLLDKWFEAQTKKKRRLAMVYKKDALMKVNVTSTDYLIGLFNQDHMSYDLERTADEPSLAEMVKVAIGVVSKNPKGYLLMVEGGRIDHGHHASMPQNAITETLAMEKAVQQAISQVNLNDTLIIVTADHAHSFGIVGYSSRTQNIFQVVDTEPKKGLDEKPYLISAYFNGPGGPVNVARADPSTDPQLGQLNFKHQSAIPLVSATHTAEDVALYATGPYSRVFYGSHDNTFVGQATMFSLCLGPYQNQTHCTSSKNNSTKQLYSLKYVLTFILSSVMLPRFFS